MKTKQKARELAEEFLIFPDYYNPNRSLEKNLRKGESFRNRYLGDSLNALKSAVASYNAQRSKEANDEMYDLMYKHDPHRIARLEALIEGRACLELALEYFLAQSSPLRIAEFGSGDGLMAMGLARYLKNLEKIIAIDKSHEANRAMTANMKYYKLSERCDDLNDEQKMFAKHLRSRITRCTIDYNDETAEAAIKSSAGGKITHLLSIMNHEDLEKWYEVGHFWDVENIIFIHEFDFDFYLSEEQKNKGLKFDCNEVIRKLTEKFANDSIPHGYMTNLYDSVNLFDSVYVLGIHAQKISADDL